MVRGQVELIKDFLMHYDDVRLEVDGEDLKTLGMRCGRRIGRTLDELLSLKVEGMIRSRQDEIKMAKELNRQQGGTHG